jgi:hypothetical protein
LDAGGTIVGKTAWEDPCFWGGSGAAVDAGDLGAGRPRNPRSCVQARDEAW